VASASFCFLRDARPVPERKRYLTQLCADGCQTSELNLRLGRSVAVFVAINIACIQPSSIIIVGTPVSDSLVAIAQLTGAAPRYFGRSEK